LAPTASFGQDGQPPATAAPASGSSVTFKIKEQGTGRVLRKVEVKVAGKVEFSGPEGIVAMTGIRSTDIIEFSRFGFDKLSVTFRDLASAPEIEIFLTPATPDDNEVQVSGKKRPEVSKISITKEEAVKIAPGGDPAQVTKLLPGVQTKGFDTRIVVRGSGPEDSLYYIDDVEVPFLFHIIGSLSIVPDQMIDEVEFSSGGFGPRYGNATGGVVVVRTKDTVPEHSNLEIKANFPIYSGVFYEIPLSESSSMSVSYRRSYIQFILPSFLKALKNRIDISVVPYFGDIHGQYLKVNDNGHYKINFFNSHDGLKLTAPLDFSQDESGKGNIDILNSYSNFSVQTLRKLDGKWTVSTTPALSHVQQRADFLGNKIGFDLKLASLPIEFTRRLDAGEKLYAGVSYSRFMLDLDLLVPALVRDDPFYDFEEAPKLKVDRRSYFYSAAAWLAIDKKFGSFTLSPGLRFYNYSQMKDPSYDPRLSIRYDLTPTDALKAAVGQYSKTPAGDETDDVFGNPNLDYERSIHNIVGWERNWSDKWSTDLQAFQKRTSHAVASDPVTRLNSKGSGKTSGFEAFIRRNPTARLFGWLSYTYSENYIRNSDQESWIPSQFDQTHVLTLVGDYKLTAKWDLGGKVTHHTGDTYTPIHDAAYNSNLDKYQPLPKNSDKNSGRLPSPTRTSLYATKDFLWDTWIMQLKFGVEELLIGEDAVSVNNNYDYSKTKFSTGVPGIPYIELRAKI
jgi:hypothetical protein